MDDELSIDRAVRLLRDRYMVVEVGGSDTVGDNSSVRSSILR